MTAPCRICLVHAFDPRGAKVGGIETYTRDFIAFCPADIDLLLIGVDGFGDLTIGVVTPIVVRGRTLNFLPILAWDESRTNTYARSFTASLTFLFSLALLKAAPRLRTLLRRGGYSFELHRSEYAPVAALLGIPWVSFLHIDAKREDEMSSLLKKYWFLKTLTEGFDLAMCTRFFCVNPVHAERLQHENPRHAAKIGTLTTWANPEIFSPTPFPPTDGALRLVYAGRMDLFKRPDKMIAVVARLAEICPTPVEFHYVGDGDITAFPAFEAIRPLTTLHGQRSSDGVAAIIGHSHVGVLTSDLEGMPRFVIEAIALGRPVCALHLPQLDALVLPERSGVLIARDGATEIERLAAAIAQMWERIRQGSLDPAVVAAAAEAYRPEPILRRIYGVHRSLSPAARRAGLTGASRLRLPWRSRR